MNHMSKTLELLIVKDLSFFNKFIQEKESLGLIRTTIKKWIVNKEDVLMDILFNSIKNSVFRKKIFTKIPYYFGMMNEKLLIKFIKYVYNQKVLGMRSVLSRDQYYYYITNTMRFFTKICEKSYCNLIRLMVKENIVIFEEEPKKTFALNYPLIRASSLGNFEVVELFFKLKVIPISTLDYFLSLYGACFYNHINVFSFLLNKEYQLLSEHLLNEYFQTHYFYEESFFWTDEDLKCENWFQKYLDEVSSVYGYFEITKLLLNHEKVTDFKKCFRNCCEFGHFNIIKVLLEKKYVDFSVVNKILLLKIVKNNNWDIIRILMKEKLCKELFLDDFFVIEEASKKNKVEIVVYFFESFVNEKKFINYLSNNFSIIEICIKNFYLDILDIVLTKFYQFMPITQHMKTIFTEKNQKHGDKWIFDDFNFISMELINSMFDDVKILRLFRGKSIKNVELNQKIINLFPKERHTMILYHWRILDCKEIFFYSCRNGFESIIKKFIMKKEEVDFMKGFEICFNECFYGAAEQILYASENPFEKNLKYFFLVALNVEKGDSRKWKIFKLFFDHHMSYYCLYEKYRKNFFDFVIRKRNLCICEKIIHHCSYYVEGEKVLLGFIEYLILKKDINFAEEFLNQVLIENYTICPIKEFNVNLSFVKLLFLSYSNLNKKWGDQYKLTQRYYYFLSSVDDYTKKEEERVLKIKLKSNEKISLSHVEYRSNFGLFVINNDLDVLNFFVVFFVYSQKTSFSLLDNIFIKFIYLLSNEDSVFLEKRLLIYKLEFNSLEEVSISILKFLNEIPDKYDQELKEFLMEILISDHMKRFISQKGNYEYPSKKLIYDLLSNLLFKSKGNLKANPFIGLFCSFDRFNVRTPQKEGEKLRSVVTSFSFMVTMQQQKHEIILSRFFFYSNKETYNFSRKRIDIQIKSILTNKEVFSGEISDSFKRIVFLQSCKDGFFETVKFLLDEFRKNTNLLTKSIIEAYYRKNYLIFDYLLNECKENLKFENLVTEFCRNNDLKQVEKVIGIGFSNISFNNNFIFRFSLKFGHIKFIKKNFLKKVMLENNELNECFLISCQKGHYETVDYLLKSYKIDDKTLNESLRISCLFGDVKTFRILFNSFEISSIMFNYLLLLACKFRYFRISKLLLKKKNRNICKYVLFKISLKRSDCRYVKRLLKKID